jgi:predicted RNase H-like HicB family nuclease
MIMMNIKEILQGYFNLTPLEKDDLLVKLSNYYFEEGRNMGMSSVEIVDCFQPLIDEAVKNDDFEVAQAFKDIKDAIEIVLRERMNNNV